MKKFEQLIKQVTMQNEISNNIAEVIISASSFIGLLIGVALGLSVLR
ncbi:hypothetical protein [Streptococcus suis]|nr:hypothetical protein [Streptococcus suis]NQM49658.1 hypothetical protein [Streptococcus suis]UUM58870.1 hypothetical protein NQZ91_10985 [Streptococcus suis]UUM63099.1 hypothetical protein NQZ89_11760 [Streptococcus suis]HEL1551518.1 hypothetical protein [Streptococcus suis]HEM2781077.1 hypothetical protein [Streptococcus suis]